MKLPKLFAVIGVQRPVKCPECNTRLKGKNVIKGFLRYCYCEGCKDIVAIG